MEGDMLKGVFTRKDNGKKLTTTRIIQGDELVQVRVDLYSPGVNVALLAQPCLDHEWLWRFILTVSGIIFPQQSYNYEGVDAKRIFKRA